MKRNAFTLIELLVVISIITLLVSIIVPSLGKARIYAKQVVCSTNLKGIGTGFVMYLDDNANLLPDAVGWVDVEPPESADPNDIIISNVMEKYVPKKAWKCPGDDRNFFESYGTSYQYMPGYILPLESVLAALPNPVDAQELAMLLITEGDDGTVDAMQPGASAELKKQITLPWPLAMDTKPFHPTANKPEGLQAVFFNNAEVLLIDWEELESMMNE